MRYRAIVAILLALAPAGAWAQDNAPAALFAESCTSCHGAGGHSPGSMPSIAGKSEDYLKTKMLAFRDGKADSTVMGRLMATLSDDEIAALAAVVATWK
jgi:sulfide dehydrogenase cytochrome subunit